MERYNFNAILCIIHSVTDIIALLGLEYAIPSFRSDLMRFQRANNDRVTIIKD